MSNAFTLTAAQKNAALDAALPSGLNGGLLKIYDGTPPANADAAATGNLLASPSLNATAFAAASGGSKVANAIANATAAASGTATYFRLTNAAGTVTYCQGTVGTSGCDLNLNSVAISSGATVSITSLSVSM